MSTQLSNINIDDYSRIQWACRRGMLELDIALKPFFKYEYRSLTVQQQRGFIALLKADDPDLFNWLMGYGHPVDPELNDMVALIRARNHARGPVAD